MTVERGEEELIAYMHWRSGEKVLAAYNHYYQPAGHATVQNNVFKKLRGSATRKRTIQPRKAKQGSVQSAQSKQHTPAQLKEEQPQSGAAYYAFLIGTGGYTDDLVAAD